eukprot:1382235-Amorphochlora_amoeboformis.AAC.1
MSIWSSCNNTNRDESRLCLPVTTPTEITAVSSTSIFKGFPHYENGSIPIDAKCGGREGERKSEWREREGERERERAREREKSGRRKEAK